ncbi:MULTISPECIES: hypothetical protein [unclassified Saccharopolyspora]|uniref:hypothetical protein n=1 Tax=unclassified Saccharopolyspora TaxID=2646250 RepID=UPI001CD35DAD|nr:MULTISPECIES: hypothetical protein [unclassified Saccharopolyspora]MCA1193392.1 hypothetical protein [Saccharopolyspora sp. 6V]MCA1226916.1 hypothetical protein [Saccharopolyspora sp. 6M]MCA1280625.1 hypothetical protein [Saccharopolyspora sp. 7B]
MPDVPPYGSNIGRAEVFAVDSPARSGEDVVGLLHAYYMSKLVSEARRDHEAGRPVFVAGFDVNLRRTSMRQVRREIERIEKALAPIGWQLADVEQFLASVELSFVRS